MRNYYKLCLLLILVLAAACAPIDNEEVTTPIENNKGLDYLIFGVYCGECMGDCSKIYKLDLKLGKLYDNFEGDSHVVYLDSTIQFGSEIKDNTKFSAAVKILDSIPEMLITTDTIKATFGCPDCADQCGYYIETKSKSLVKKFYIDTRTTDLTPEMKTYSQLIGTAIGTVQKK